jgi:hypothetical protein
MENLNIKGFPEEIGQFIDLPDIAELLLMPMFDNISAEDLRKHGTEFQKFLLDKVPLRNTTKYVAIKSFVQFLYPGIGACDIKIDPKFQDEWHIDFDIMPNRDFVWHILTSECTSRTEFNINPSNIVVDDLRDARRILNEKQDQLNLVGKKIDSNKFCTFNTHVHRPTPPKKPEFRFFFRVQETSYLIPKPIELATMKTKNNKYYGTTVHHDGQQKKNLEHVQNGIFIHYPWIEF